MEYNRAMLMAIRPEWLVKILNGEKTIEVRKLFPKDYVGWVYLYCSKGIKKNYHVIEVIDTDTGWRGYEYDYYLSSDSSYLDDCLEGKVVARFWCDKVEEIVCHNMFNAPTYNTELLFERQLCIKSCLGVYDLFDYLGNKNGYAIHISKLEIFDRPKELSEFYNYDREYYDSKSVIRLVKKYLTKAPQNYCYIEGE